MAAGVLSRCFYYWFDTLSFVLLDVEIARAPLKKVSFNDDCFIANG
jgi:hypothetical protein